MWCLSSFACNRACELANPIADRSYCNTWPHCIDCIPSVQRVQPLHRVIQTSNARFLLPPAHLPIRDVPSPIFGHNPCQIVPSFGQSGLYDDGTVCPGHFFLPWASIFDRYYSGRSIVVPQCVEHEYDSGRAERLSAHAAWLEDSESKNPVK